MSELLPEMLGIYEARDKKKYPIAIKFIEETPEIGIPNILEIETMARIKHPNLIRLQDIEQVEDKITKKFYVALIMSFGVPLMKFQDREKYKESFLKDLVSAVVFLHEHEIYHCHIKPENLWVMVDRNLPTLVLSNFEMSLIRWKKDISACQSNFYLHPDYWDLGMAAIYILIGKELSGEDFLDKGNLILQKEGIEEKWREAILSLMGEEGSLTKLIEALQPLNKGEFEEIGEREELDEEGIRLFNGLSSFLFEEAIKIKTTAEVYLYSLDSLLRLLGIKELRGENLDLLKEYSLTAFYIFYKIADVPNDSYIPPNISDYEFRLLKIFGFKLFPDDLASTIARSHEVDLISPLDYENFVNSFYVI